MESLSLFIEYNNTDTVFTDIDDNPYDGLRIAEDGITLLRFKNGLLNGDQFDSNGNLIHVKPAIEGPGRIEYWRNNKLHKDDGFPAVTLQENGKSHTEYWENGIRIK